MKKLLPFYFTFYFIYTVLLGALAPSTSWAQEITEEAEEDTFWSGHWWGFGAVDFGIIKPSAALFEADKSGIGGDFKFVLSYYKNRWVYDGAVGWSLSKTSGSNSSLGISDVTVFTRAALFELGARYRIAGHRWQIGPVFQFLFGTDMSYSEVADPPFETTAIFGGAQLLYELPWTKNRLRIGTSVTTDINILDRQVWRFFAGVQFGFPIHTHDTSKVQVTSPTEVAFTLRKGLIFFDFDSANLSSDSILFLEELSKYLKKNDSQWKKLVVEGHTDKRGTAQYNIKLSNNRAGSVREALLSNGLESERVSFAGYGFNKPAQEGNTEKAFSQNRRVELKFQGVTDPEKFSQELNDIRLGSTYQ